MRGTSRLEHAVYDASRLLPIASPSRSRYRDGGTMQDLKQQSGTALQDQDQTRINTKAYAATSATSPLDATTIPRREPTTPTYRSRFFSVASATPTCTTPATSGTTSCRRSTPVYRAMRSSA